MFFYGQYQHTIDEKGRLTIPSRFRDLLAAENAFVMQWFDRNLKVFPSTTFERISHKVQGMNEMDRRVRLLKHKIFSTASLVEVDRAGRILVPQYLRQFAGLETEAMLVGVGNSFEIWSPAVWSEEEEEMSRLGGDDFSSLFLPTEEA